jgi:hypothetical protein
VPASPAPERDKSVGAGSAGTEAGKGESITDRPGRRATLLAIPAGTFLLFPPGVVHGFDNDSVANARCFNLHAPSVGFGDYLRGRNPDFDQHDPPPDGGADPASTLAIRLSEGG